MHTDRYLAAALALAAAVLPALGVQRETSFDRTLNVTGPVELEVSTGSGGIAVRAGEGRQVRVHGVIRTSGELTAAAEAAIAEIERNPPIRQEGNVIRIGPVQPDEALRRVSVGYEITVPRDTRLRARTGSGSVKVSGIAGPVRAHTGSGAVEGDGIAGAVVAHTGSGSIRLEQTAQAAVTARTGSGTVTVRLPPEGGFELRGHTGSGQIEVAQPATIRRSIGSHELNATLRGGGPVVEISTGSGSIRIE